MKSNQQKNQSESDLFKVWIIAKYRFSPKTVNDILCRVKRMKKYSNIDTNSNPTILVDKIRQHPDFQRASSAVYSQLQNAMAKYILFMKQNNSAKAK